MSYNITTFKVKEIEDLIIPVESLFITKIADFYPEEITEED